ncbi:cyclic GMP-AMP synthase-like isoform X2 [Chelonus insularis]|uniref:cyclic GMP-AMP synthase-like isoform X2 n=1 Tax=Chelonus insularis TaxID=460826 RepID=UPI00158C6B03|nr:cyclic GMP-AMP synthase-like isoform X2 [Chelonus insularis]
MISAKMNAEEQNRRFKDTAFNTISPLISLQKEETDIYNRLLREVTENVIQTLQKDDLFKYLYRTLMYVGSFYKQTRVGKPEEFDINIIIKLPNIDKAIIEKGRPGFARIKFRKEDLSSQWTDNKILKNWLDAENYLNNEQVRRWFESMSQKSLNTLEKSPTNNGYLILPSKLNFPFEIKIRKNGPAFTLCVIYESKNFDVDLVPVLEFKNDPPLSLANKYKDLQVPWYLVPKPLTNVPQPHRNWRYCFYRHEQKLLKDFGKIKSVIRTIKKLRDTQEWPILESYYIETLFYQALGSALNSTDVQNSSQTYLTIFMLKRLRDSLHQRKLNYFWDPSLNLFQAMNESQMVGIANRIEKIIKDVEKQPESLYNYIFTKEELQAHKISNTISQVSTPSTPKTFDGSCGSYIPFLLKSINNLTVQEKPQTDKTKTPAPKCTATAKPNEQSEIKALQNLVLTLINEVKDLKTKVVSLENKIDAMNQHRSSTYVPDANERAQTPGKSLLSFWYS